MDIKEVFKSIEAKLQADLREVRASMNHAASKGAANEEAAKVFLRSRLPRTLEISTGFLIDCSGAVSKQLDIIIHDAAKTPILFERDDLRVIPVECAYAVIEVKTDLTLAAIELCVGNMRSVKSMTKKAFYDEGVVIRPTQAYGREHQDWPLMYFVFAYDSAPLGSIAQNLAATFGDVAVDKRIDCIYSLERGLLANRTPDGFYSALPAPGSKFISVEVDALLLFYTLLAQYMNQTHMRNFRFSDYLKAAVWPCTLLE
ncbi:hypothetical protein J3P71_03955 [Rhizobium leguminosarum]|uniref:DUF6602 domain-containing protein n=1 Tax=Rhizobium leguminosarum TaxID=384 RepID=UPI001441969B|nr:DUF6602 domain-containing protein [Rhizobium leguminosarum]MBY5841418.1 hypothetical protein [Rhizobium leguminosarum]NKM81413.1 hypothetical protein [Rhizobium leguminosarum bv. viciae]QSZ08941.1 hypothetical protein J3P71_03955 [Rhizobium leguminosarum]